MSDRGSSVRSISTATYLTSASDVRQDWKRHKPACKPAKSKVEVTASDEPHGQAVPPADRKSSLERVTDGKERSIEITVPDMPGGKLKVSSTTLSASALRAIRDSVGSGASGAP